MHQLVLFMEIVQFPWSESQNINKPLTIYSSSKIFNENLAYGLPSITIQHAWVKVLLFMEILEDLICRYINLQKTF